MGAFTGRSTTGTWRTLPLRKHFKLFCNLRPARLYKGLEAYFCPLILHNAVLIFYVFVN